MASNSTEPSTVPEPAAVDPTPPKGPATAANAELIVAVALASLRKTLSSTSTIPTPKRTPTTTDSLLCEYCVRIPFDPESLNPLVGTPAGTFLLGSWSRLEDSACPFCLLVRHAYYRSYRQIDNDKQIRVTWNRHAGPGQRGAFCVASDSYISFAAREEASIAKGTNGPFYVKPATGPGIDIAQVRQWVSRCENGHSDMCSSPNIKGFAMAFPNLEVLRLIDVEETCIVEMRALPKYVVLSYVWGSVSSLRLTKANRNKLLVPGSLGGVAWDMLPRTVQDAITLAQRLGTRYLWVDALCLLQNDSADLGRGVNVMDLIYEQAWLTIIAGYGHNANAGLPGVRQGSRKAYQNIVQIKPGVSLGVNTSLDELLASSVYNSRAWTFQERLLSRRALYFIDKKLLFRCRMEELAEACVDLHPVPLWPPITSDRGSALPEAIQMTRPINGYPIILHDYTSRVLTNQADILRAMAGIIRRFTDVMRCRFFEGLPTALFDAFLLFRGKLLRRRSSFPSYSWTGWHGAIQIVSSDPQRNPNKWLTDRTWIVWYSRSVSGGIQLIWDPAANPVSIQPLLSPFPHPSTHRYQERHPFSFRRAVPEGVDRMLVTPTRDILFRRPVPEYAMLQFWTLATFYTISDTDEFRDKGYLLDRNQNKCGIVWFDDVEESTFFEQPEPFEVILLSEASDADYLSELKGVYSENNIKKADWEWRYYNILLLEWRDGIAERRGIGSILQRAVENSFAPGPVWKEIFLA